MKSKEFNVEFDEDDQIQQYHDEGLPERRVGTRSSGETRVLARIS
jgi:hypothetical protein